MDAEKREFSSFSIGEQIAFFINAMTTASNQLYGSTTAFNPFEAKVNQIYNRYVSGEKDGAATLTELKIVVPFLQPEWVAARTIGGEHVWYPEMGPILTNVKAHLGIE